MKTDTNLIIEYLDELLPDVGCELFYSKDYELLIAVMLSAQTTDKAVNKVTNVLFNKYPNLESLSNASIEELESCIKAIGLYKNKAKNIKAIAFELMQSHGGKVPHSREQLSRLPGVGHKTAGVVLAELFNDPEFPVDTHVARISKRLNLASNDDTPIEIENKLKKAFPKDKWIRLHHQFIHFGRYYCFAKSPNCKNCKLLAICKEKTRKN